MDYLTRYYKNMSEQLQEQISLLENQINEVYARNPELQFQQGEFAVVKRHGGSASTEDPTPSGAGTKRLLQMLHLHTALNHPKILPHEGVAIQRLLDDMAKSKPGDTFVGKETPEEKERKRVTDSIYSGISKQRRGQGISYHPNDWEGQDAEFRRAQNASDIQWTTGARRAREAESSVILRTALGAVKRLSGTEEFQTSLKKLQDHIDKKAADEALGGDSPEHYYAGRLSREQDEKFEDARFNKAQEHVLGFSGKQRPTKINEESESNKEELARINRDRREEGKPPFKTLDAALKHYEEEDKRARDKKRKISESKINKLLETSGYPGDDAISREVARERRNMTPEQKRAEMARQLDRINASRIKSGQKPFASMEEYVEHARKENEAFALARQRQTKERIETWANTPEGQAHIAAHTPTPTTNVTPQQY